MASRGNQRARVVRLEEYASTGERMVSETIGESLSRVKIHAPRSHSTASGSAGSSSGASRHQQGPTTTIAASASHRQNDKYMEEFNAAYEELHAAATGRKIAATTRQVTPATRKAPAAGGGASSQDTERSLFMRMDIASTGDGAASVGDIGGAWLKGPMSPEGILHAVSAQPLMCMSMSADGREVVVGSSDHALYVIPLRSNASSSSSSARSSSSRSLVSASKPKTLYSKKFGHSEWVTCVTHLADNRIVSGGMDSKLCLWDATGVKCEDLVGHSGSVSLVQPLNNELIVSAGYDKTIRVWNVGMHTSSRQRECSSIKAGSAPILNASLLFGGSAVVCGDRDGSVHMIDLENAKVLKKLIGAHKGHTTSVLGSKDSEADAFYSGGQDGVVKVWDARQKAQTNSLVLHIDPRSGKCGAVGFIHESPEDSNVLITGGADGTIKVLDKRASFGVVHDFIEHMDFIYSLHLHGQLCFSGAGNGMLHVHDWKRGKLLYGLGANQAAVRAVAATSTQLVAAGDDGGVVVYDML